MSLFQSNFALIMTNKYIFHNHYILGMVPVIPECQESGSIIFPERNEVVSVACDVVCIREGTRVTLDCTVTSGTPPITYTWTDGDGNVLSNQPTLTVSTPDNYSCNAENLDAPENREISLLSCKLHDMQSVS